MSTELFEALGTELAEAERERRQVPLISARQPGFGLDEAYAIQRAMVARKLAAGGEVVGWKIGLTSRAMQQALGIDTPDSGVLFADMLFDNGGTVPAGRFIQPRIEAEIAFITRAPLSGDVSREQVIAATEAVVPSLEILDTRVQRADPTTGASRTIVDTVADNAANAGLVLGDARHAIDAVDLRWTGAIVRRDGVVEETGLGAGVLDDPVTGIIWLARRLASQGDHIAAGQIVLSGSFIRPIECPPGSHIEADFGAFGRVDCHFAAD